MAQEEFEAGDEAIKAVDAREKRDAERKAAGEVEAEEEEDDDADASKDGEEKAAPKAEEPEKEEGELTPEAVVAVPTETPAQAKRALKIAEAKAAAVRSLSFTPQQTIFELFYKYFRLNLLFGFHMNAVKFTGILPPILLYQKSISSSLAAHLGPT